MRAVAAVLVGVIALLPIPSAAQSLQPQWPEYSQRESDRPWSGQRQMRSLSQVMWDSDKERLVRRTYSMLDLFADSNLDLY